MSAYGMVIGFVFGGIWGLIIRGEVESRRARARAANERTLCAADLSVVGGTIIVNGGPMEGKYEVLRKLWFGRMRVRKVEQ